MELKISSADGVKDIHFAVSQTFLRTCVCHLCLHSAYTMYAGLTCTCTLENFNIWGKFS